MKSNPVIRYRTNAGGVLECLVNTSTSTGIKIPEMERNFQTINNRSWKKFDSYVKSKSKIWIIEFILDNWTTSTCSCPVYQKQYMCKHLIGIAAIKKLIEIPDKAKDEFLCPKLKRGRPRKVKNALVISD